MHELDDVIGGAGPPRGGMSATLPTRLAATTPEIWDRYARPSCRAVRATTKESAIALIRHTIWYAARWVLTVFGRVSTRLAGLTRSAGRGSGRDTRSAEAHGRKVGRYGRRLVVVPSVPLR
jgi:hypothetical protein